MLHIVVPTMASPVSSNKIHYPSGGSNPPNMVQGGFDPSKKSGVGVDFELLVRSLQVRNKGHARKTSMIFR